MALFNTSKVSQGVQAAQNKVAQGIATQVPNIQKVQNVLSQGTPVVASNINKGIGALPFNPAKTIPTKLPAQQKMVAPTIQATAMDTPAPVLPKMGTSLSNNQAFPKTTEQKTMDMYLNNPDRQSAMMRFMSTPEAQGYQEGAINPASRIDAAYTIDPNKQLGDIEQYQGVDYLPYIGGEQQFNKVGTDYQANDTTQMKTSAVDDTTKQGIDYLNKIYGNTNQIDLPTDSSGKSYYDLANQTVKDQAEEERQARLKALSGRLSAQGIDGGAAAQLEQQTNTDVDKAMNQGLNSVQMQKLQDVYNAQRTREQQLTDVSAKNASQSSAQKLQEQMANLDSANKTQSLNADMAKANLDAELKNNGLNLEQRQLIVDALSKNEGLKQEDKWNNVDAMLKQSGLNNEDRANVLSTLTKYDSLNSVEKMAQWDIEAKKQMADMSQYFDLEKASYINNLDEYNILQKTQADSAYKLGMTSKNLSTSQMANIMADMTPLEKASFSAGTSGRDLADYESWRDSQINMANAAIVGLKSENNPNFMSQVEEIYTNLDTRLNSGKQTNGSGTITNTTGDISGSTSQTSSNIDISAGAKKIQDISTGGGNPAQLLGGANADSPNAKIYQSAYMAAPSWSPDLGYDSGGVFKVDKRKINNAPEVNSVFKYGGHMYKVTSEKSMNAEGENAERFDVVDLNTNEKRTVSVSGKGKGDLKLNGLPNDEEPEWATMQEGAEMVKNATISQSDISSILNNITNGTTEGNVSASDLSKVDFSKVQDILDQFKTKTSGNSIVGRLV